MKIYLVGGAVRDKLLRRPVHEKDWLVTGATHEQMLALGYRQLDAAFPVFLHPETNEEYALARREIKQGKGYKGFTVETSVDIGIEEDLKRRDLTVNAMAMDDKQQLIDPYGGQADLHDRLLRHVSEAFQEDPFRLVRTARFAAQLGYLDFHVSHATFQLMKKMAVADELQQLSKQRFMQEMDKALSSQSPEAFFKVLGKCGALDILFEGANHFINGESMKHGEDSLCMKKLKTISRLSDDLDLRFAAVFGYILLQNDYDVSQYYALSKPRKLLLKQLGDYSKTLLRSTQADEVLLAFEHCQAFRQPENLTGILLLLNVFYPDFKPRLEWLESQHQALLQITSQGFIMQGLSGKALGDALRQQRLELLANAMKTEEHAD